MQNTRRYLSKDLKIAIIGAGISGLTAAHTLKKFGYNNVTIFESGAEAGGKIHTLEMDGYLYELGAIFVPDKADTIRSLAKDYNITLTKQLKKVFFCRDGKQISMIKNMRKDAGILKIIKALLHLPGAAVKIIKYLKGIENPGLAEVDPETYINFKKFLDDNKIGVYAGTFEPLSFTYCYGYLDTTPTLYFLKLIRIGLPFIIKDILNSSLGFRFRILPMFDRGYQNLLTEMAKKFNVRYKSRVTDVTRKGKGDGVKIRVTADKETETYDRIIISSMPGQTMKYLDMTKEEKNLLSKTKTYAYHQFVFRGDFKLKGSGVVFDGSYHGRNKGFPSALSNFHKENNIYQTYQMHDGTLSEEELKERLIEMADIMGGKITEIMLSKNITYFPHYTEEVLAELEPFKKFEAMQGENGTYYIGSLFNMEGSNWSSEYAEAMIKKYF